MHQVHNKKRIQMIIIKSKEDRTMSRSKNESSYRYWTRLSRDHAQPGKDRTKSRRPRSRTQRGGRRNG